MKISSPGKCMLVAAAATIPDSRMFIIIYFLLWTNKLPVSSAMKNFAL